MNKKEFIAAIAERTGMSKKDAAAAVTAVVDVVKETVKGGDVVSLQGFGTFKTVERAARTGRNPQTGEAIEIPAKTVAKFAVSKAF